MRGFLFAPESLTAHGFARDGALCDRQTVGNMIELHLKRFAAGAKVACGDVGG